MSSNKKIAERVIEKFLDETNKGVDFTNQDEFNRFLDNTEDLYEVSGTQRDKIIKCLQNIVVTVFMDKGK
ncbi:hypothetical protein LSA2308_00195 [Staphylococcus phage LSA2308]|uniref:Uncharacterized protein n=2 Tax=Silviavirus remus TaxID=1857890 RepID=S4T9D0_9CAUD|nr:hypothetical protein O151_gp057 [Staphylococcus phage vB_SauM_Remus]APC43027.1 hypothetical protein SAP1_162 [Staphylococcus phage StAP1]QQO38036.1 hypothetical protein LSA2308_00015 [Staphylococcus phage LSA2308]QVD58437.1 hypothetical protein PM93_010 [Staphylococcus phage PM93]QVD58639.1 hypothetical protein Remus_008 [Silviavirus remus]USZ62817.1 hypothetical protein LSA2311_orf00009 [Staphylococcus phage LSA2311]UVD42394.1 hypothetical protein [Staphylococcus phage vB_SauM-V1SA19]